MKSIVKKGERMKKILILLLLFLLLIPAFSHAQSDCDLAALQTYLEIRRADIDQYSALIQSSDVSLMDVYNAASELRQKYEDRVDIPNCAFRLHILTIGQMSNAQEYIFFAVLNAFSETPVEELPDAQRIQARQETLRNAAIEEEARLLALIEPQSAAATPTASQPLIAAPPAQEPAALSPLESALMEIEGVKSVRMSSLDNSGDTFAYFELDLDPGYNTQQMAEQVYQVAYAQAVAQFGSGNIGRFWFSVILWDGQGPAVDWVYETGDDVWTQTQLSMTPSP